jgi:hypothetical protein
MLCKPVLSPCTAGDHPRVARLGPSPRCGRLADVAREYVFVDEWDVDVPREAVFEVLADARSYPEWWRPVYLESETDNGRWTLTPRKGGTHVRFDWQVFARPPAAPPAHAGPAATFPLEITTGRSPRDEGSRAVRADAGTRLTRPAFSRFATLHDTPVPDRDVADLELLAETGYLVPVSPDDRVHLGKASGQVIHQASYTSVLATSVALT